MHHPGMQEPLAKPRLNSAHPISCTPSDSKHLLTGARKWQAPQLSEMWYGGVLRIGGEWRASSSALMLKASAAYRQRYPVLNVVDYTRRLCSANAREPESSLFTYLDSEQYKNAKNRKIQKINCWPIQALSLGSQACQTPTTSHGPRRALLRKP